MEILLNSTVNYWSKHCERVIGLMEEQITEIKKTDRERKKNGCQRGMRRVQVNRRILTGSGIRELGPHFVVRK